MSIVRSLRAVPDEDLDADARKLLTFVDNRQDAALQAGHFNDFVEVTMIRGALYRAAREGGGRRRRTGLCHDDIASRRSPARWAWPGRSTRWPPGEDADLGRRTDRALREVVNLRVYLDLDRGWRVTMPNLESTGLLEIGYLGLTGVAARDDLWRGTFPALARRVPEVREQVCRVLLDEMRRSLAIDAECFAPEEFDRIKLAASRRCAGSGPWRPPTSRRRPPCLPGPGRPGTARTMVSHVGTGQVRPVPRSGPRPSPVTCTR